MARLKKDRSPPGLMAEDGTAQAARRAPWRNYPWVLANGLLLAATLLFIISHLQPNPDDLVILLRRVSEAALVGGVADWFAVVALFRHPLGLPIPHTAVIPRNKDRIGVGLGQFVERHLLDPDAVAGKLRSADLPLRAARWLAERDNAALLADRAAQALSYFIAALPDEDLRAFVRRAMLRQLSSLDVVPIVATIVERLRDSGRHQELFDTIITGMRRYLAANRSRLHDEIHTRSAWWVPAVVDRGVASVLLDQAASVLDDLMAPESGMRQDFDRMVGRLIDDIRGEPRYREQIEALKLEVLASEALNAALDRVAGDVRHLLIEDVADRRSAVRTAIADGLVAFAGRLIADEPARRRIERRLVWVARSLILPWRRDIGTFIADVVRGWEARTVSGRIEEAVGRDLQYIRVNGTLVGGIVGGLIFLLSERLF